MTEHELNPEFRLSSARFCFGLELALKLEQLEVSIESPSMVMVVVAIKEEAVVIAVVSTDKPRQMRALCLGSTLHGGQRSNESSRRSSCPCPRRYVRAGSVWRTCTSILKNSFKSDTGVVVCRPVAT